MKLSTFVLVVCAGLAPAHAENGVWIGDELDPTTRTKNVVVLERRDDTLLLSDDHGVWLGDAKFVIGGPGTKGGVLQFDVDVTTKVAGARGAKALAGVRKGTKILAKWSEDPVRGLIRFCMASGTSKVKRPERATELAKGVRCFMLERLTPSAQSFEVAPKPSFECMRDCRQANMMRAVSAEVIEADCEQTCTH